MKNSTIRVSLAAALIALAGEAAALGLGELRGAPVLGERARFEVELLGSGTSYLDTSCFRLKQPVDDAGLPWLKQGTFALRHGNPAILEVRSAATLSDPAFAVAVYVGCGHDVVREYVVLAARPLAQTAEPLPVPRKSVTSSTPAPRRQAVTPRPVSRPAASTAPMAAAVPAPAPSPAPVAAKEQPAQDGGPAADEKIKRMEATVGELQQRAAELTQKIEQAQPAVTTAAPATPAVAPAAPVPVPMPVLAKPEEGSNWGLYGALLAILAIVAGGLGWRSYSQRRAAASGPSFGIPDVVVDPQRKNEREERGGAELQADPVAMVTPVKIAPVPQGTPPAAGPGVKMDSLMSVSAATVDEHFEANPVMELAEIMLSFGRVKGAAQALQEYIDANPQDALKPWVRLMDVYRMAGMRHEFEKVARELNKNFNVQIQQWETLSDGPEGSVDVVLDVDNARPAPKAIPDEGIEGVAWIMEQVLMRWPSGDVVDYLNQLLRDNRGGTRTGFALSVVNDIMFLIDLKEFSNKLDSEAAKA